MLGYSKFHNSTHLDIDEFSPSWAAIRTGMRLRFNYVASTKKRSRRLCSHWCKTPNATSESFGAKNVRETRETMPAIF